MRFNGPFLSVLNGRWGLIPIRLILAAGSCMLVPVLLASPSRAQPIPLPGGGYQIDLNKTINGASPAGSGPWLSLQITDIGTPGSGGVSILFTPSLAPTEFITKVGLNLTQAFQAANPSPFANLSVSCDPAIGGAVCSNFNTVAQVDGYSIEGNAVAGFDLGFNFTGTGQNGGAGRLTDAKSVRLNLTGTALSAKDLLGVIKVKGVDVNAAAKVQGIRNGGSGVVADPPGGEPVPGPLPILGAAAAFQASRRLRHRLKSGAAAVPRSA